MAKDCITVITVTGENKEILKLDKALNKSKQAGNTVSKVDDGVANYQFETDLFPGDFIQELSEQHPLLNFYFSYECPEFGGSGNLVAGEEY